MSQNYRDSFLNDSDILSMVPDTQKKDINMKDFYTFSTSIRSIIDNITNYVNNQGWRRDYITVKQFLRSIIRTQLVHNVNFKGQITPQLTPFDKSIEQKRSAVQKIIDEESKYYESVYKISQYMQNPKRFCIVVPSYNNVKSKLYLRNLDSIFMQDYDNYHVVYIDDASPDKTGQYVQKYIKQKNIPDDKIKIIINSQKKGALYNIYYSIHQHCSNGQIVGLIDGDDSFNGIKVIQLFNAIYKNNFLRIRYNQDMSIGFGRQITRSQVEDGELRLDYNLVGTHWLTFYSDVFKKIKKQDLMFDNGTFYDAAYDKAITTPIAQMVYPRMYYIPQLTYEYRNDTGINDRISDWHRCADSILSKPIYKTLQNFDFIS